MMAIVVMFLQTSVSQVTKVMQSPQSNQTALLFVKSYARQRILGDELSLTSQASFLVALISVDLGKTFQYISHAPCPDTQEYLKVRTLGTFYLLYFDDV